MTNNEKKAVVDDLNNKKSDKKSIAKYILLICLLGFVLVWFVASFCHNINKLNNNDNSSITDESLSLNKINKSKIINYSLNNNVINDDIIDYDLTYVDSSTFTIDTQLYRSYFTLGNYSYDIGYFYYCEYDYVNSLVLDSSIFFQYQVYANEYYNYYFNYNLDLTNVSHFIVDVSTDQFGYFFHDQALSAYDENDELIYSYYFLYNNQLGLPGLNNFILYLEFYVDDFISELDLYSDLVNNSYSAGYEIGYNEGYDIGYEDGYDIGYEDGLELGYDQGYNAGEVNGYDEGYDIGYDEGYDNGHDEGYNQGYNAGVVNGFDEGYDEGYEIGVTELQKADIATNGFKTLFNAILNAPYNIFSGLLNFEILGVNLFSLFSFIFTTILILSLIKFFLK